MSSLRTTLIALLLLGTCALAACGDEAVDRRAATQASAATPAGGAVAPANRARVHNGPIVRGDRAEPVVKTAPRLRGGPQYPLWAAFDQDSELFLFVARSGRVFVVGQDGSNWDLSCSERLPGDCGRASTFVGSGTGLGIDAEAASFGPGADEITVPVIHGSPREFRRVVTVTKFDGTVRKTLDMSAIAPDRPWRRAHQAVADLAWSPDRSRLAVATQLQRGCSLVGPSCEGRVWVFDGDGGKPQPVYTYTEPAPDELVDGQLFNPPTLHGLAWSPDGRSLALVAAPGSAPPKAWPQLVVLRLQPGQPVRADRLHIYDDYDWHPEAFSGGRYLASQHDQHYAFAWSPDGKRIAVTSEGGIAEISAEDGEVLDRHPGGGVHGPLAWLRKR